MTTPVSDDSNSLSAQNLYAILQAELDLQNQVTADMETINNSSASAPVSSSSNGSSAGSTGSTDSNASSSSSSSLPTDTTSIQSMNRAMRNFGSYI